MNIETKHFIGGHWVPGTGAPLRSVNPARIDDVVVELAEAGSEQADLAVEAAARAAPGWRATRVADRARYLATAARIMRDRKEVLARAITREVGKTLVDARAEVDKACEFFEHFAGEGSRWADRTIPARHPGTLNFARREPLGVVGLVTPWNVPLALPCWKLAPALICGNTVVLKPSQLAPGMASLLATILAEAELPAGVFNLVIGGGSTVGRRLAAHPAVRAFSFTGGARARSALYADVSRRMARFSWSAPEAGGKNPIVVMDDADLDLAARGIVHGAFTSSGERCTASSRLLVHHEVADALLERVVERTRALVVGDGLDPRVDLGPVVSEALLDQIVAGVEAARAFGAKPLTGGARLDGPDHANGWFVGPAIVDGVTPDMAIWTHELFGPTLAVARFREFDEALRLANDSPFRLASAIYTRDADRILRFIDRSEARMVHINAPTVSGEPFQPYAGIRADQGGAAGGTGAIEFFSEEKVVLWSHGVDSPLIHY